MSHPRNRRERFLFGKLKGEKRARGMSAAETVVPEWFERTSRMLRNTTKICSSLRCCGNPRRRGELTLQEIKENQKI